jgi:hypothetical protein
MTTSPLTSARTTVAAPIACGPYRVVAEQAGERGTGPGQPGFDGSGGGAGVQHDVVHRHVEQVVQGHRLALGGGQPLQGGDHGHPVR